MAKSKRPTAAHRAFVEPLIEQKLANLRLLRGLDAAGVVPGEHASLPIALASLLTFDEMAGVIILSGPDGDPELVEMAAWFAETGPDVRQEVLGTLPPALRLRVTGAAAQAVATEAEVMKELDALREAERPEGSAEEPAEFPDLSEHLERMADAIAGFGRESFARDERVARQEAKSLPLTGLVDAWLERLPVGWLKNIASRHELNPRQKKADLVCAIAEHLLSPESLRPVLAMGLDKDALACLAELVALGDVIGAEFDDEFAAAAGVSWDWMFDEIGVMPPGRLRHFGLAFVGRRSGSPRFAMPVDLHEPVAVALLPLLREAGDAVPPDIIRGLEIVASGRTHEISFSFDTGKDETLYAGFDEASERPLFLDVGGPETILELEVSLRVEQCVSRRILVSSRRSLGSLHEILQITLGWEDYHLHQFNSPSPPMAYGPPDPELDADFVREDEWEKTVGEVLPRVRSTLQYEYDFGDSWHHDIRCVARHAPGSTPAEPHCLAGKGACPPEDVGGAPGYAGYLAALADPDHPEHETMVRWRGPGFDPLLFDLKAVNARLAALGKATV